MNKTFLRNFRRIYRPKGLLTRDPGEPPETFEQLQQRALERERAEQAQQAAAPRQAAKLASRRDSDRANPPPNGDLAKARKAVRNAERTVRRIEREIARAKADVRRWKAQGKILKRSPIPKVPVPILGPLIAAGRLVLEYLATPSNLEGARLRVERWSSALPLAKQHLERVREQLRQVQE